jgi:hypothetical protein
MRREKRSAKNQKNNNQAKVKYQPVTTLMLLANDISEGDKRSFHTSHLAPPISAYLSPHRSLVRSTWK